MKNLPLHVKIVIGLVLGIVWAFISSALGWNTFTITWIDPFGVIFIRLLKFIAVPLVLFSIISGVSGLSDVSKLGRLGGKTLGAYLITTVTAVGLGLLLVNLVKPGDFVEKDQRVKNRISFELWLEGEGMGLPQDGQSYLSDPQYQHLITDAQKANQLSEKDKAEVAKRMASAQKQKEVSPLQFIVDMVPENVVLSISNNGLMLQVIFFSIFFGITLVMVPEEKKKPVVDFIQSINEVFLKMVNMVMNAAPFFVFALLAGVIAKMADTPAEVFEIFLGLGSYSLTLVAGLFFLVFAFYPLVLKIFVPKL
ncbi:cation:dicarboxylase symporter family transporter, partial [Reichenbachiella sp.]